MDFRGNVLDKAGNAGKTAIQRTIATGRTPMLAGAFFLRLIGNHHFAHRFTGCEMHVKAAHDFLLSKRIKRASAFTIGQIQGCQGQGRCVSATLTM